MIIGDWIRWFLIKIFFNYLLGWKTTKPVFSETGFDHHKSARTDPLNCIKSGMTVLIYNHTPFNRFLCWIFCKLYDLPYVSITDKNKFWDRLCGSLYQIPIDWKKDNIKQLDQLIEGLMKLDKFLIFIPFSHEKNGEQDNYLTIVRSLGCNLAILNADHDQCTVTIKILADQYVITSQPIHMITRLVNIQENKNNFLAENNIICIKRSILRFFPIICSFYVGYRIFTDGNGFYPYGKYIIDFFRSNYS